MPSRGLLVEITHASMVNHRPIYCEIGPNQINSFWDLAGLRICLQILRRWNNLYYCIKCFRDAAPPFSGTDHHQCRFLVGEVIPLGCTTVAAQRAA